MERCLVVEADEVVFRRGGGVGGVESVLGWSSRKTVCEVAMPVRVVRKVLRRMRKIQALKLVPGWKESKARRDLEKVSCTRSSASA